MRPSLSPAGTAAAWPPAAAVASVSIKGKGRKAASVTCGDSRRLVAEKESVEGKIKHRSENGKGKFKKHGPTRCDLGVEVKWKMNANSSIESKENIDMKEQSETNIKLRSEGTR